jgi:uncharacterized membrane protein YjfL (UPF0719 family)
VTQTVAIVSALAELLLSFLFAIFVAYFSFRIFNRITRDVDEINELKKNNVAAGLLLGSLLISSALILREAIYPTVSALQTRLFAGIDLITGAILLVSAILYAAIAAITSIGAIALSMKLFLRLTRDVDELTEISRNNVAVAITLGSVIIVLGLFLSHGVQSLLSSIIPDPVFAKIQLMGGPR